MNSRRRLWTYTLISLLGAAPLVVAEPSEFDKRVAPLLANRCLSCHRGEKAKGGLDLSRRAKAFAGGDSGIVLRPEQPEKSLLWQRIDDDEMPPKHPLPKAERTLLRDWIRDGAKWGTDPIDPFRFSTDKRAGYDWWSLQPLRRPTLPELDDDTWSLRAIDKFVLARLRSKKLRPSPRADARTLVRRVYFDLVGLPPSPEVVDRFVSNPTQEEWVRLVDELLASPDYAERWARHWLDVVRFGETNGYEYNEPRNSAWPYRDWVIRSIENDLPYDRFVRMQLAGDVIAPGSLDGSAAVGFLVAGVHNTVLGVNPKMKQAARQEELEDMVATVGQTFLGLTVNCARCHDHKFDPITTAEYYQLIAALSGVHHGTRNVVVSSPSKKMVDLDRRVVALEQRLHDSVYSRNGRLTTSANRVEAKLPATANRKGVKYRFSFSIAPSVWASPAQASTGGDGIVFRILGTDGQLTASELFLVQGWNGGRGAKFVEREFEYTGSGTEATLRIEPTPIHSNRFGGAIDDIVIRDGKQIVFRENFEGLEHRRPPGAQAHTGVRVFHSSTSKRWTGSGTNSLHSVERAKGNLALQLFSGQSGRVEISSITPEERRLREQLEKLTGQRTTATAKAKTAVYSVVSGSPGVMRIHRRGNVSDLGDKVDPKGIASVGGLSPSFGLPQYPNDAERRLALAKWITHRDDGPFHRVIVNRVWHYHFGRGIVESPSDLGFNGGRPTHPELLNWLAVWFRDNDYSLKRLHKLIVTSATYQQSPNSPSKPTQETARSIDRSNALLWRQNARRIEAESFRDALLDFAGVLNRRRFGPGFRDVRIDRVGSAHYYIPIDPVGPEFERRTLYRWQARGQRSALLETFDCPDPSTRTPVRSVTTTPSQVLSQWNASFVLRMAEQFAGRVRREAGAEPSAQVRHAWRLVLGREPDEEEAKGAEALLRKHGLALLGRVLFNSNELIWIE